MLREACSPEAIADEKREQWWPAYAIGKGLIEPNNLTIVVTLHGHDVWCPGWFSHWTFDVGMSDADVLDSFERYVERILRSDLSEAEKGSLMGRRIAGDGMAAWMAIRRARRTEFAPCRCPACKALGLVRIDH